MGVRSRPRDRRCRQTALERTTTEVEVPMRTVYMAYCFLREALHRFTGMEREASPATTLFMTAIVAGAVAEVTAPIFRVLRPRRPKPPSLVDCLTGVSVVRF